MELEYVDAFEAEPLERSGDGLLEVSGRSIVIPDSGAVAQPSGFGGDDQTGRIGGESLGDQLFRDVGAVRVGGVDEVDA